MKGMLLLSGGIDSPVAGFVMKEKGNKIDAIHFSFQPFTNDTPQKKSKSIAEMLGFDFFVCEIGHALEMIARECTHRYYFVLTKRLMLRVSESFAKARGCDFLVTGENLGQVSSQTLENLFVIDRAVSMPVLRPLVGYDKLEIVNHAIRIGTYDLSKGPEVCDVLGPRHPSTSALLNVILDEESKLNLKETVKKAFEGIREV